MDHAYIVAYHFILKIPAKLLLYTESHRYKKKPVLSMAKATLNSNT